MGWTPSNPSVDNWLLGFEVLELRSHEAVQLAAGDSELIAIPLTGHALIDSAQNTMDLGDRQNVFSRAPGAAVVLPPGSEAVARSDEGDVQLAVVRGRCGAEAFGRSALRWDSFEVEERGEATWQRTVRTISGPDSPTSRALIGETLNPPGNWSSFPPHKHDEESDQESRNEEIYYFRIQPASGFAVVRLYSQDRVIDEAFAVYDGDLLAIPCGYHTVAAPPGYDVYYLWALSGPQKTLRWRPDPEHDWIAK
jgi:5-deoxy-glucuronate isomerase